MKFTDLHAALERQKTKREERRDAAEPKWLDGTPKNQGVRDHAGNAFDRERFLADPEYRVKNRDAYVRMRHVEDEQQREKENAEANERKRAEMQARQDARIRGVAEAEIARETQQEAVQEREQKIRARVEELRPSFSPIIETK